MQTFLLLAAAIAIVAWSTPSAAVPTQWAGNGHFYEVVVVGSPVSWADARAGAQAIGPGWDLATITSAAEDKFVRSQLTGSFNVAQVTNFIVSGPWLGGFNVVASTDFEWVTGEPVTYTNWGPFEPLPSTGLQLSYANFTSIYGSGVAWNDIGGSGVDGPIAYVAEAGVTDLPSLTGWGLTLLAGLLLAVYPSGYPMRRSRSWKRGSA